MAEYIYFDAGGGGTQQPLPSEGDTLTGASSGASSTVHRVIQHGGSTANDDAYGYFVLTGITNGPFADNEKLQVSAVDVADADGANVQLNFSVGGVYQFVNSNFFGGVDTYRTYGVNGVDPAFEIDESLIVSPILLPKDAVTGQPATNDPFLIEAHRNYLCLAYPGGSLVLTVIGEPLVINGFLGAAEFGMGDEITGLNSVVGSALVCTTGRETRGLFGKDSNDWELKLIGEATGGKIYTASKMDTVYSLDDLGITSVSRTDSFGSFMSATVSQLIQPLVTLFRDRSTTSTIVRASNQYRLYFDDGSALVMYIPTPGQPVSARQRTRNIVEFGQILYPDVVRQMYADEDGLGAEIHYFISDDGFVRQDQKGNNFNGGVIRSSVRLVYNQINSPSIRKKFRRAILELDSQKPLTLKVIYDLTYGGLDNKVGNTDLEIAASGGLWDVDNWDEFFWDGQTVSTASVNLGGTGTNISLLIFNESATARPFVAQGITLHYEIRRQQR